jgi:hypothetical protein
MRRLAITLSAVAAVVFAVTLSAQGKDFSGKWAPDADKNPAAAAGAGGGGGRGGGRGGGGGPMTITMDAKTMKIERMAGQNTVTSTYNLDGSESKNSMAGRNGGAATEVVSVAKWDGAKLVITTKNANGDQVSSYYMEGSDLVVERAGQNGPQKTFYKKS